jgi:hypothetical protein
MSGVGNAASATAPQKCFNGAQHKEFSWFEDHILRFNPAVDGNKMIKLASFVDVRKAGTANVEPVIIELGDYNIQWNQGKQYNKGAGMKDRIIVVTNSSRAPLGWLPNCTSMILSIKNLHSMTRMGIECMSITAEK